MPRARTGVLVTALAACVIAACLLPSRGAPARYAPPAASLTQIVIARDETRQAVAVATPAHSGPTDASNPGPPGSRPAGSPPHALFPATAEQALRLPAGPERCAALSTALETWILSEPAAVNAWAVERLHDQADWDLAASLLIRHTDTLHRTTQVAREWAESIRDGELRARALEQVAREWAGQDAEAARTYVASTPSLDTAQRAAVLRALTPRPPET